MCLTWKRIGGMQFDLFPYLIDKGIFKQRR